VPNYTAYGTYSAAKVTNSKTKATVAYNLHHPSMYIDNFHAPIDYNYSTMTTAEW